MEQSEKGDGTFFLNDTFNHGSFALISTSI